LERVSPLDVSNLRVEERGLPMHVAALAVVEEAPLLDASGQLRLDRLRDHLDQRLHLAPRLRQVLYFPRLGLGPPAWVDHAGFDIREHVRTRAVAAPGDEAALLEVCAELNEPPLDRSRPLWELWVLTGRAGGQVGLLVRFHHVLADGIAALAMIGALLDPSPTALAPVAPPWAPRPAPGARALLVDNLHRRAAGITTALSRFRHPAVQLRRVGVRAGQISRLAAEGRAPRLSLNRPVGRHRRLLFVRAELGSAKEVAHSHAGTVNDVLLAAIGGGARGLLQARGELSPGLVLKCSVAASIRVPADEQAAGNRVGIMLVPVPVDEPDPVRRLRAVARATARRKRRPAYQPFGRFAQRWMVRAMFHQRLVNLFESNLPGPPAPVYFAGGRVLEVFVIGVVQGNVPLSVAVLSYAGQLNVDIVADADAVPDLPVFADGLAETLGQLGTALRSPGSSTPP
jgi:WS/DGAT/MGAT family acyltransferase